MALTDVGMTGTRGRLVGSQGDLMYRFLHYHRGLGFTRFHHGDCVGADEYGARVARKLGYVVISHPPSNDRLRAFADADEVRPELSYMQRNAQIVDEAQVGMGVPNTDTPDPAKRSGTWATIDMFARSGKPYVIFGPELIDFTGGRGFDWGWS